MFNRRIMFGLFAATVIVSPVLAAQPVVIAQSQTPAQGANSFTEGQAKSRIEGAGYSAVSDLKQDDKGVWHGMGTKDGKQMPVGLDFKGNVVTQ